MAQPKTDRPRHLKVIGTRIAPSTDSMDPAGFKSKFHELLADVPVQWNFDTDEGEALLEFMEEQVKAGADPETLAAAAGMDDLAPLYREWASDRG